MSKIYCAAPWHGLHINPFGNVKTCCAGDPNILGNLNTQNINDILHSEAMKEIRSTLRKGRMHEQYCYNCIQAERYGRSERNWHNSVSEDFDSTTAELDYHRPVLVDVRWNITCNQSCNYCGDKCSSKWAALQGTPHKSQVRPYYQQVHNYLEQYQGWMREVALVGGEPLLLPENERLLDIVSEGVTVTVITNFSMDLVSNKIFEKLSQRNKVGWSLSFDNIGERYEYVRYGGKWAQLERNIELLKPLFEKGHWGGIHAVYNLYNATRLNEFTDWARKNNLAIQWQSLYQPECLDPLKHNREVKKLARAEIETLLKRNDLTDNECDFFNKALNNFNSAKEQIDPVKITQHINGIETLYHSDKAGQFHKLWPELACALGPL
jgi:radical SAM protein with 4Fe4S-binding SPASM domain